MLLVCFCVLFGLAAIAADDLNINTEGGRQLLRTVKSIRQINYLNIKAYTVKPRSIRARINPPHVYLSDQS
jgi:hypothetical protein